MSQPVLDQIKYQVEKAGFIFDEEDGYSLTTPTRVASMVSKGMQKVATFSPYEGEKLVVMCQKAPRRSRGWEDKSRVG